MSVSASQHVTVIFSADDPGRGGALSGRAVRTMTGLAHLSFAGALFYVVWWPLDFRLTEILLWTIPFTTQWQIDEAMSTLLEGPTQASSPVVAGGTSDRTGDPGEAFYPSRQRAPILILSVYGWQTLAAVAVFAWALSGGLVLGRVIPPAARRVARQAGLLMAAVLMLWAVWTGWTMRTGFPVSTGQIGVGGVALICACLGLGFARGGGTASLLASVWLILTGAAAVVALTLMARCDALHPEQSSTVFKLGAFLLISGYGWIVLPAQVLRARRSTAGFVRP